MNPRLFLVASTLVAIAVLPATAGAWTITQVNPASGADMAEFVAVPFHSTGTTAMIELHKYFLPAFDPDYDSLLLQFTKTAADSKITSIVIVDEIVMNMMNVNWDDYHNALISDPQHPVTFVNPASATAWQMTGGQSRLGGTPSSATVTQINWQTEDPSQAVPYGAFTDAPTNQLVIRGIVIDVSTLSVGQAFELKEWPTVPEPITLTIFGLGMAGLVVRRRSRA